MLLLLMFNENCRHIQRKMNKFTHAYGINTTLQKKRPKEKWGAEEHYLTYLYILFFFSYLPLRML